MATPGGAVTGQFAFSTATVCIAPQASLKAINPAVHSVGLTKNVRVEGSPQNVDLTEGIRQDVVASVTNRMQVTAGFEVYEYTSKNFAYGLGLDGSGLVVSPAVVLTTGVTAAAATTISVAGNVTAAYPAGTWAFIQDGFDDKIYVFKVASSAFSTNTTITMAAGYAIPATMSFPIGSRVGSFNKIDADPSAAQGKYYAVQITGISIMDQRPMVIVFPKARITKGFGVAFSDSNFSNLPFEITPMKPLPTDAGYDADFRQIMTVLNP